MKYILLTNSVKKNGLITIDETAKKDFIQMMDWTEEEFEKNTVRI